MNKVLDPIQIGFTATQKLTASMKCCTKAFPEEKVGVVAKKNGKYAIVEYSELSENHVYAKEADGETLTYRLGSILVFMLDAKTLLQICTSSEANSLYHKAHKKVEYFDLKEQKVVKPEKENAWKFELFLQNFVPLIEEGKLGVLDVDRLEEFAPIKNADQPGQIVQDSPSSATKMILEQHSRWLSNNSNAGYGLNNHVLEERA